MHTNFLLQVRNHGVRRKVWFNIPSIPSPFSPCLAFGIMYLSLHLILPYFVCWLINSNYLSISVSVPWQDKTKDKTRPRHNLAQPSYDYNPWREELSSNAGLVCSMTNIVPLGPPCISKQTQHKMGLGLGFRVRVRVSRVRGKGLGWGGLRIRVTVTLTLKKKEPTSTHSSTVHLLFFHFFFKSDLLRWINHKSTTPKPYT